MQYFLRLIEKYKLHIFIPILLFLWKLSLFLYLPKVSTDGPWTLSHLFSFIRGDINASSFAHNFDGDIYKTHVLEIILSPFYSVGKVNTYVFIVVGFLFIAINLFLLKKIVEKTNFTHKKLIFLIIAVGYLTSNYTYNFRAEIYVLPFIFSTSIFLKEYLVKKNILYLILIGLFSSISFLIHPVSVLVSSLLIIYFFYKSNFNLSFLFQIALYGLVSLLLVSGFNILDYFNLYLNSNEAGSHSFTISLFFKYLLFNPYLIIVIASTLLFEKKIINLSFIATLILLIASFGRSYYFRYLLPFLFIVPMFNKEEKNIRLVETKSSLIIASILLGFSFYVSHFFPTIQNIENPQLGKTFKNILKKTDAIGESTPPDHKIWVSSQLGMEVIDQPNSRLHHHFYKVMATKKIHLKPGDKMYFWKKKYINKRLKDQVSNNINYLSIKPIIKSQKNHYRFSKPFIERSSMIGLWEVSLKQ